MISFEFPFRGRATLAAGYEFAIMADGYGQYSGWDAQPANFQYPAASAAGASNDYQMNSQPISPDPQPWTGLSPQYAHSANNQQAGIFKTSEPLGNQFSPHPGHRKIAASETALGGQDNQRHRSDHISRSPPAAGKSEKRRQQNRTSQIAFRQRSKMTLMMLQDELDQSLMMNETLYGTIEVLLEKTEDLKRCIEDVLAARLKRGRSESYNSPRASSSLPLYSRGRRR